MRDSITGVWGVVVSVAVVAIGFFVLWWSVLPEAENGPLFLLWGALVALPGVIAASVKAMVNRRNGRPWDAGIGVVALVVTLWMVLVAGVVGFAISQPHAE